ncbi:MAG TPA: FmdB family zinc ribbon protein [Burkholderiales bacterium]|nr:FmdB family zinc ribbon protein [Burkholderiales bacterium]
MPIYEYRCASCGFKKDVLQKMSDGPLTRCPECGKPSMQKQVSAAGFQLKGKGWYVTDFKKADKPKKEEPKSSDEKKPAATCRNGTCPACE